MNTGAAAGGVSQKSGKSSLVTILGGEVYRAEAFAADGGSSSCIPDFGPWYWVSQPTLALELSSGTEPINDIWFDEGGVGISVSVECVLTDGLIQRDDANGCVPPEQATIRLSPTTTWKAEGVNPLPASGEGTTAGFTARESGAAVVQFVAVAHVETPAGPLQRQATKGQKTNVVQLKHSCVYELPHPTTRLQIGVFEQVVCSLQPAPQGAVTWVSTPILSRLSTPGPAPSTMMTALPTGGNVVVSASTAKLPARNITFEVLEPGVLETYSYTFTEQGNPVTISVAANVYFIPAFVNFTNVILKETDAFGVGSGFYASDTGQLLEAKLDYPGTMWTEFGTWSTTQDEITSGLEENPAHPTYGVLYWDIQWKYMGKDDPAHTEYNAVVIRQTVTFHVEPPELWTLTVQKSQVDESAAMDAP